MRQFRIIDSGGDQLYKKERQRLKTVYKDLYIVVSEILFRHDPIGINFEDNTDEYESEASAILPRLASANSTNEVRMIIHEEFVKFFDEELAGEEERYSDMAEEVWRAWQEWSK